MTIHHDYFEYTTKWKKEYGEKTIVLLQVGSFYEVYALKDENGKLYGSNILDYSNINDLIIAKKQIRVKGPIKDVVADKKTYDLVMAGFGCSQIDKYVCKLQEHGYTIVIYDQDIQGKNSTRSMSEIISPGTYFTQNNTSPSNHAMCIWLDKTRPTKRMPAQIVVGISWIDIFTGNTKLSQFTREYNHNPCTYDELERIVAINNPSECIVVSNQNRDYIDDIINFAGISSKKIHSIPLDRHTDTVRSTDMDTCIGADMDARTGTVMVNMAISAQKQTYQQKVFERFFPSIDGDYIVSSFPTHFLAIQSFIFLLDFIYKQNPHLVDRISLPCFESSTETLVLANHSLQQLNMIHDGKHDGKLGSVSTLLNNCVTTMGRRRFLYNLHNPITDTVSLNKSYSITEHIIASGMWTNFREALQGIHDMEKLKRKIIMKRVVPKDIYQLIIDLRRIISLNSNTTWTDLLKSYLQTERDVMRSTNADIDSSSREINSLCNKLIDCVDTTFYSDKCGDIANATPEYFSSLSLERLSFIRPGVCEEVDALLLDCVDARRKLNSIAEWLSTQVGIIEKKSKTTNFIKIHETPKTDPVLLGTKRRITLLKSRLDKISQTNIDRTVTLTYVNFQDKAHNFEFSYKDIEYVSMGSNKKDLSVTNGIIKQLANSIQTAENKLVSATLSFYRTFVDRIASFQYYIEDISNYVTILDTLQCKCYIAEKYNYCKPEITASDKAHFHMVGLRHPLIEQIQTREIYVSNDVSMGSIDASCNTHIDGMLLYGTNAVGKTSLIKSIGINIIMAQAGLYVSCDSMKFSPYTAIFTRILGNDNIFKGLSTFEVEMSELSTILKMADKNSLILGDELCSGTESDSALSIFTASLETLHERNSTFLFATHFHEIQNYNEITELSRLDSKHMEVTYDKANDTLVYDRKLRDGSGDSMYGLEVCKSLHLPDSFLDRAHSIRMKYNDTVKNILSEKGSRYNKQKVGGLCELCGKKRGADTHHLQHQQRANEKGFIGGFHKNHKANLMTLCKKCHQKIHETDIQHVKVKTSKGYSLKEV